MNNIEISHHLQEFSDLLEFKGENVFKINAYRKAARIIDQMTESVDDLSHDGKLMDIPGIGAGIAKDIQDLLETGRIAKYDQEKEGIPDSALELMAIGSLGPKTASFLFKELHIKSVDELEVAVKEKKLQGIPGYGVKKEENIRRGIELYREGAARMLLGTAFPIVESLLQYLKAFPVVKEAVAAGSFRRMKETVGDIDILCISDEPVKTIEYFNQYPDVEEVIGFGDTKSSIRLINHLQVDLRVLEKDSFGAALQYFTGSKDHNVRIREIARQKGLKVNEYGVFRGDEKVAGKTEEDVYASLGLPWISPELREDNGEIQAAQNNTLPQLIEIKDIQGDLHCHTTWSDGRNSLEEMVDMARGRGYKYMAITDHSSSVKIANGLSPEKLVEQGRVIREMNKKFKDFTILAGSEVDIKPDGSLDFPDEVFTRTGYCHHFAPFWFS